MTFKLNKSLTKTLNYIGQAVLFIAFFIALSTFLARDMLKTDHVMGNLANDKNAVPLSNQPSGAPQKAIKDWAQAPQHLVYFFAPWCTVCALSQPSLSAFADIHPDVQIIMVALDWEASIDVTNFKQKHQFKHPILLGNQSLKRQWKIDAYPSYYFVDNTGRITSKDRGLVTLPGLLARSI
ncbi:MAG: redoxin family protein [Psychrobium sp.]|nr:redoxin family protein [Psychrobium sp.]